MSETLDRWKLVTDGFAQRLSAVEQGQWENSTPCPEFTVRQLVEHVIDVQRMVPRLLGASGAIDTPPGSDLVSVWKTVRDGGGRMALCNVSAVGGEILRIAGFDTLWPICASREEALEAVKK